MPGANLGQAIRDALDGLRPRLLGWGNATTPLGGLVAATVSDPAVRKQES